MNLEANSPRRWVVAHSGARDQYQLPLALRESDRLLTFVTDLYGPFDNPFVGPILRWAPKSVVRLASRRYNQDLPSRVVRDLKFRGTVERVCHRDPLGLKLNRLVGERAASIALRGRANLLITSYYGWAAFPLLRQDTAKVLFQVHPHPGFLRDLYVRLGIDNFREELEVKVSDDFLKTWGRESLDADLVIAASEFTRTSLLRAGVLPSRIAVLPYGVDSTVFRNDVNCPSGKARVLFVGQPVARKGFDELLRTWGRIKNQSVELHIVAPRRMQTPEDASAQALVWHERLPVADLVALMNSADLLVLPSIAEGFGHVLLQALSCGTPILASDATAGPDILAHWEEGFTFASGDWAAFASRLDYWLTQIRRLRSLRSAARILAERFSWQAFRQGVRQLCDAALNAERVCGVDS